MTHTHTHTRAQGGDDEPLGWLAGGYVSGSCMMSCSDGSTSVVLGESLRESSLRSCIHLRGAVLAEKEKFDPSSLWISDCPHKNQEGFPCTGAYRYS